MGGGGGGGGGARVSDFFTKNLNLKYFFGRVCVCVGGRSGVIFYHESKFKIETKIVRGGGGGEGGLE